MVTGDTGVREAAWQVSDRIAAYRTKLLTSGFQPIPVNGKAPVAHSWQNTSATVDTIEVWSRELPGATNTGILTKDTPAIDIDVYDCFAADELQKLAWGMIDEEAHHLVRIGQAPKRALLFRTDAPFAKLATPVFISPDGKRHKVEVLCDGQQIVVNGALQLGRCRTR
jgi:Bifunctional DNA primase/polymerase, N-terminal